MIILSYLGLVDFDSNSVPLFQEAAKAESRRMGSLCTLELLSLYASARLYEVPLQSEEGKGLADLSLKAKARLWPFGAPGIS